MTYSRTPFYKASNRGLLFKLLVCSILPISDIEVRLLRITKLGIKETSLHNSTFSRPVGSSIYLC